MGAGASSSSDFGKGVRYRAKYLDLLDLVAARRIVQIDIDLDDIVLHNDASFAEDIARNTPRYVSLFSRAIDQLLEERQAMGSAGAGAGAGAGSSSSYGAGAGAGAGAGSRSKDRDAIDSEDIADVMLNHRVQMIKQAREQDAALADPAAPPKTEAELRAELRAMFPPALLRRYEVRIRPRERDETSALALRQVRAGDLGKLVTVRAMVLRASDVRPIIQVAAYTW